MAVVGSNLDTGSSTTDGLTFNTASITPASNALILIGVTVSVASGTTVTPSSVSGNGITYTLVTNTVAGARTIYLYRGMAASPTTGAITFTTVTTNYTSCLWTVAQFTGVDTSGTNGSGAVVQSINGKDSTGTNNSPTVSFTTTPNAANAGFGVVVTAGTITAGAAGTGWTLTGNTNQTAPVSWSLGEFANSACPAAVTAAFTGTAGNDLMAGAEILPAAGVTAQYEPHIFGRARLIRASQF